MINDASSVEAVKGQLTVILRPMYGNPCRGAARILEKILTCQRRRDIWKQELRDMVQRIKEVKLKEFYFSSTISKHSHIVSPT